MHEYLIIYKVHMSPALYVVWCFKHSDAIEIHGGITFSFYTVLPYIVVSEFW